MEGGKWEEKDEYDAICNQNNWKLELNINSTRETEVDEPEGSDSSIYELQFMVVCIF